VPCNQEGLSSKMFATVSRHVEHFSAEENSIKVWQMSLAAPVDGGVCTDNVQNLLKKDLQAATYSELNVLFWKGIMWYHQLLSFTSVDKFLTAITQ
jgi:hypothetical protein